MTALDPQIRPRLRNEVLNQGIALRDRITGAVYPLSEFARQIVDAVGGQLTVTELLAKVVSAGTIDQTQVERELRRLLLLRLLERHMRFISGEARAHSERREASTDCFGGQPIWLSELGRVLSRLRVRSCE
jgi:hypothetical protein